MIKFLLSRLLTLVPIAVGVSAVVFVILRIVPGDIVLILLGEEGSREAGEALRAQLGLDRSLPVQFVDWIRNMFVGDLGVSLRTGQPVIDQIAFRIPPTVQLTFVSTILSVVIGVPIGVLSALKRNSLLDLILRMISFLGLTVPSFWLALLLVYLFSLNLGWLPSGGYVAFADSPLQSVRHTLLPGLALALPAAAVLMRFARSAVLDIMTQEYIVTARSKGLTERRVIYGHALKNAMVNILTILGLQVGFMLGGSIAVEVIFRWPGMGQLTYQAIASRDYTLAQGATFFVALFFAAVTVLVDLLYTVVDPRIRYE